MKLFIKKAGLNIKKIFVSLLCFLFMFQQSMLLPVLASTISGVDGVNNPGGTKTYDINPMFNSGNTGFRYYNSFNLSQGDIANLIFQMQSGGANVSQFVNLVNNQIVINGMLNTMQNGAFYNGHAIFVSPNGMVVGASGVLNVGSLTALSPDPVSFAKYSALSFAGASSSLVNQFQDDVISVPGLTTTAKISDYLLSGLTSSDVSLDILKGSDQTGDVTVNGKVFARGDVNIYGKNILIGAVDNAATIDVDESTSNTSTGIFAGVQTNISGSKYNQGDLISSDDQAQKLFNALVKNNIQEGASFANENGKIAIKAQAVKTANVLTLADKFYYRVAGSLIEFTESELAAQIETELFDQITALNAEVTAGTKTQAQVDAVIKNLKDEKFLKAAADTAEKMIPASATDPNSIEANKATVTINNAYLGANDVDVSATSVVNYNAQKGNALASFIDSTAVGNMLQSALLGTDYDYEGARAKATIDVGSGSIIKAANDITLNSLAVANANMKVSSLFPPLIDTASELYYSTGTKTVSSVNVKNGAELNAAQDLTVNATSKNTHWVKIKDQTSVAEQVGATQVNLPSVQVSVVNSKTDADTTANIENGASITAKNVAVNAVNVTNDLTSVTTNATIADSGNLGVAVAVSIKNADINTSAIIDTIVNTNNSGTVSVNAQNLHTAYSSTEAKVETGSTFKAKVINGLINKSGIKSTISSLVGDYVDTSTLSSFFNSTTELPSASASIVYNNSDVSTVAEIGKNAKISADNVNLNANTIDLTINNSSASVSDKKSLAYAPSPGISLAINKQKNTTTASIQDGNSTNSANVKANKALNINATLEQPMNESTLEFLLNLCQTGSNLYYGVGSVADAAGNIGGSDWDIRELAASFTNLTDATSQGIKDVMLDLSMSGLSSTLGLKGFFNNWVQSTSNVESGGAGLAASILYSSVLNNTTANIGNYSQVNAQNVVVNAANKVIQNNAVGDVAKLWSALSGSSGDKGGIGGSILLENVESNALAKIGDNAVITSLDTSSSDDYDGGNVNVNAANNQNFISLAVTGSKTSSGAAISGSVVVQDVKGKTEASCGDSNVNAKNLNVVAGKANIALSKKGSDQLFSNPFKLLDPTIFDVDLSEVDTSTPQIASFAGIDSSTGLITLKTPNTISDGVSNIVVTGAVAKQSGTTSGGSGATSSSGVGVGASVAVSEIQRNVTASVADGADITLSNNLKVNADSYTQGINVALAGAFAGGVNMKKTPDANNKSEGFLSKVQSVLSKVTNKTDNNSNASVATADSAKTPSNETVTSDGKDYTAKNSLGKDTGTTNTANSNTAGSNMSAALAGALNAQIDSSNVTAKVGNANIKVGNSIDVNANQTTKMLNIATGVAKAATIGAGAGVNLILNSNQTNATIGNSSTPGKAVLTFTDEASTHSLNVKANEDNDNVQVAVGVGVTSVGSGDANTALSAGGSFNTDVLENSVVAKIENSEIKTENVSKSNIDVSVNAENHSASYKGAGGLSISKGSSSSTAIGAGMAGNINVINKKTSASISNSNLKNTNDISVTANKDKTKITEDLVSVGVAGSVVSGASSSYTFSGAIGVDVIDNIISASISDSTIQTSNDISVLANQKVNNWSVAGALGFSTAASGGSFGVGSIVNVILSDISATISDTTISKSKSISINSNEEEALRFLAVNLGIQTSGGTAINANAIVNVLKSDIAASLLNSTLANNLSTVNVASIYNSNLIGTTDAVAASFGAGIAAGGNLLSNTMLSSNTAKVGNSNITSGGKLTVKADSDESIDVIPLSVAITASGSAAVAANVGLNFVKNKTSAYIDGSTVSSNGIEVLASDDTSSRSRGGTIAASGGTAAIGGSIVADIYIKDIDAYIDNSTITNGGNIKVSASALNTFGTKNPGSITASALSSKISNNTYDVSNDLDFYNWEMTFDAAGGNTAGVSGSIISKNVINSVNSYIGSGATIEKAGSVDVLAKNETYVAAIVGNVTGAGTAAIGGSLFSNVNKGSVTAAIKSGAKIGSSAERVGVVNVDATSSQIYKTIMFVVGGAGTTAVNGSINSNILVNDTNSYIAKGVDLYSGSSITVDANDLTDVESLNLAVSGSGTASVGGIVYSDVFASKVNANIGSDDNGTKNGNINADGKILVNADMQEGYQANVLMVAGSGVAAVSGVGISNVIASKVNAGIEEVNVTSTGSEIEVKANHGFNESNKSKTLPLKAFITGKVNSNSTVSSSEISNLIPLVSVLNIAGSGTAGVTGSVVSNVVTTQVNAYVKDAAVNANNGLKIDADSIMTTYDAVMGVAGSAYASVALTGVVNTYAGSTKALLDNSTINAGSVALSADDLFNLNTIIFTVTGSGIGASVTGITNTNTIVNDVFAEINNSNITANSVGVDATNTINASDLVVAGAGNGIGAGVNAVPVQNIFIGETKASVSGGSIANAATSVNAKNDIETFSTVVGLSGSGIGATVAGYLLTNVFDNDLISYIDGTLITNASSTSVKSESVLDMFGYIISAGVSGIGASVLANGITSVVDNNIASYIKNSTITGGSVSTESSQIASIVDSTASTSVNGIGDATALNSIVHVFSNKMNSYIKDSSISDASNVSVKASSNQDISSNNAGISGSGTAAVSANALVNVLESEVNAYIDNSDKNISASGKVDIVAKTITELKNIVGLVVGAGGGAAGVSANVNIINNAVKAELLSSTGVISGSEINVDADSELGLNTSTASAALGGLGLAGTVAITSIGDRVNSDGKQSDMNTSGAISSVKASSDNIMDVSYEKDGVTKSVSEVSLTSGASTAKKGTVANINAKAVAKGVNGVKVTADNVLRNAYSSGGLLGSADTAQITNANITAGGYTASASVLVTDMKYNTTAGISGGNVVSETGGVLVRANNTVKANTNAIAASVSGVSIGGNAAYFKNEAKTEAVVDSADITAVTNVDIIANSIDNIVSKSISANVGLADISIGVSLAETNNTTTSKVTGTNVDIIANDLNVESSVSSSLSTELLALKAAGVSVGATVNTVTSNALTSAIVDASGNIALTGDMNVIAYNKGISATNTFYAGTLALYSAGVTYQGAFINSDFIAGIGTTSSATGVVNVADLNITGKNDGYSENVTVKAGVNSDKTTAGTLSTDVQAKQASASYMSASVTAENSKIDSDSIVTVAAKKIKANNLTAVSKSNKNAQTGSVSGSIGELTLSALIMDSSISGTNVVNIGATGSSIEVSNLLTAAIVDASSATSKMVSASLSVGSAQLNKIKTYIDTDTTLSLAGNVNAKSMDIDSVVSRHSYSTAKQLTGALVSLGRTTMTADSLGDSIVNYNADSTNTNYVNAIDINSIATNTTESYMSNVSVALAALSKDETKNRINTSNKVQMNSNAKIKSSGTVKASVENVNQLAMTKESSFKGFLGVYGGKLTNDIDSNVGVDINGANISAQDVSLSSKTGLNTLGSVLKYNDSTTGFISSSSITLSNNVSQSNNITVQGDSKVAATNNVNVALSNKSEFDQAVYVESSSGFGGGHARSPLTVANYNTLNVKGGSDINAGNQLEINFDSNNDLSSYAKVDSSAFAGNPSVSSYINLTINNTQTVENGSSLTAGKKAIINFMKNSKNVLDQYAYVYAEAAIASADWAGGINYTNNNTLNVNSGADVTSLQDVAINYMRGTENFSSTVKYKKVSRLLFGIKITKSGSSSRISKSYNNTLALNGTIEAGAGANRVITLDKNGDVVENKTSGFTSTDYTLSNATNIDGETATSNAKADIIAECNKILEETYECEKNADGSFKTDSNGYYIPKKEGTLYVYKSNSTGIEAKLAENTDKINLYNSLLSALSAGNTITFEEVINQLKPGVQTAATTAAGASSSSSSTTGTGESAVTTTVTTSYSGLTESDFNTLWGNIKNSGNTTDSDITQVLNNYTYTATETIVTKVGSADPTTATATKSVSLCDSQKSAIKTAFDSAFSTQTTKINESSTVSSSDSSFQLTTYNGKYVFADSSELQDVVDVLTAARDNIALQNTDLTSEKGNISSQNTILENKISDLKSTFDNLTVNPLQDTVSSNSSITFKDIIAQPAKITVSGLSNLTGSGVFKTPKNTGLLVNNYSSRDIVFNNILFNTSGVDGLTINGVSYNNAGRVSFSPSASHTVQRAFDTSSDGNITINTYYDHNNPLDSSTVIANILFNGTIKNTAPLSRLNVFNDSGNITFNNLIQTTIGDVVASQGDINFLKPTSDVVIASAGNVRAGKDIVINAKNLVNNGTVKAGNANRNITIDESLYDALGFDSNGVNNQSKTLGSTYLNGSNNIKLAKDTDGNIHVYNTEATSGSVAVSAVSKSGSGTYSSSDGYGTINITNNTPHKLIVHNLTNNYKAGELTGVVGAKTNFASALTSINSPLSAVEIAGVITSGNKDSNDQGAGTLAINAKTLTVQNIADNNIDTTGTANITTNDGLNLLGWIKNRKGSITIKNTNSGNLSAQSGSKITNDAGTTEFNNSGSGQLALLNGAVVQTNGLLNLINSAAGGTQLAGSINNTGVLNILNSSGGALLSGDISNTNGKITIDNSSSTSGLSISGTVTNNATDGGIHDLSIVNSAGGGLSLLGTSVVTNGSGLLSVTNNAGNLLSAGNVVNNSGNTNITNKTNGSALTISGTVENKSGSTAIVSESGSQGITVTGTGKVINQGSSTSDSMILKNSTGTLTIAANGELRNSVGNLSTINSGSGGTQIQGSINNSHANVLIENNSGNISISGTIDNNKNVAVANNNINIKNSNIAQGIFVSGNVSNYRDGNMTVTNEGTTGIEVSGTVSNASGKTTITNTNGTNGVNITNLVSNKKGDITIENSSGDIIVANGATLENNNATVVASKNNIKLWNKAGSGKVNIAGLVKNNSLGDTTLTNEGTTGIEVSGTVSNASGKTTITNTNGTNGIKISGKVENDYGVTEIANNKTGSGSGVKIETTGSLTNKNGNINVSNKGSEGIIIEGIVKALLKDIELYSENSNITIGEYASANGIKGALESSYLYAKDGNINVTINNGSLVNGILTAQVSAETNPLQTNPSNSPHGYKTLMRTSGDLTVSVTDGNIGEYDDVTIAPGFSIDSKTRDYSESINVDVAGKIKASSRNSLSTDTTERLINLRSKDSDMNLDRIYADGNIILTAADWKYADVDPKPSNQSYYQGYSILNKSTTPSLANVEGKNISIISSNTIGDSSKALTFAQKISPADNKWVSYEAENDVYLADLGAGNTNLWQAISKRGSMDLVLANTSIIRSITAGKHLHIVNKGKELTIYDIGIIPDFAASFSDMLYPHDGITLTGVSGRAVPESIQIEVLDANGGATASSKLNIYNAYLKGRDPADVNSDVILRADNIVAHSANAQDSPVVTRANNGFDASEGRSYFDNPIAKTGVTKQASGFNSYGPGDAVSFNVKGVSPALVALYNNGDSSTRSYNYQDVIRTINVFDNPYYVQSADYLVQNASLSLNVDRIATENRGLVFDQLYVNNAYVETQDLGLGIKDAIVKNYAEFKNGNYGSTGLPSGGRTSYRWNAVVDNDYRRLVDLTFGVPVTLQLYTEKTGSFGLTMGDLIVLQTKAPIVDYNPYEVANLPQNENSFYRQTFKDDKIQEKTTTPEFKDIDKSTNAQTMRDSLRFEGSDVSVSAGNQSTRVYNISKTGMEIDKVADSKIGDTISLNINIDGAPTEVKAKIVRIADDGKMGVKFENLDKATANKILYLNMLSEKSDAANKVSKI